MECDESAGLVDEEPTPTRNARLTCARSLAVRLAVLSVTLVTLLATVVFRWPELQQSLLRLGHLEDVVQLADKGEAPNYRGGGARDDSTDTDMGICVGHVISAGAWAAGAALKIRGATVECDPLNFGVGEGHRVYDFRHQLISLDPTLRGPLCARNILGFVRDAGSVGTHLETAADFCSAHRVGNVKCASTVTNAVRMGAHFSRFASELDAFCPENSDLRNFFICANRIEGMGWALDSLLGAISGAARACGATPADLPKAARKANYGACVGEVLGAAGFIAAAGFNTWNAANFSCLSALDPAEVADLTTTAKDRINARCAQLSASSARQLAIATAKATEAAGHCSGMASVMKEAQCGRTLSLGLAALAGAAEGAGFMRRECGPAAACCQARVGSPLEFDCDCTAETLKQRAKDTKIREKRCARFASSTLKELSMVWTMMSEGASECGEDVARNACSHFLGGTFAGFFFFAEAISRMSLRCKDTKATPIIWFACSQDQGFMGEGIDTMASAIGAALRDCALGWGNLARKSDFLGFGRRYFLP